MVAKYLHDNYIKKMYRQDFFTVLMLSIYMTIDGYRLYKEMKGKKHAIAWLLGMITAMALGVGGPIYLIISMFNKAVEHI